MLQVHLTLSIQAATDLYKLLLQTRSNLLSWQQTVCFQGGSEVEANVFVVEAILQTASIREVEIPEGLPKNNLRPPIQDSLLQEVCR